MQDIEYLKKYYNGDIEVAIKRLNQGEPVQYIVGNVDFYGNIINVCKDVLIPRFETEGLVELALQHIKDGMRIVDLGTGSGCIAITIKKKLPNCIVDAVDISKEALKIACKNAKLNNTLVNFYNGDMLEPLNNKYDCIISNPPYISKDEEVMDIVKNNEPNIALYANNDGLYYYEKILRECSKYLNKEYVILFEIGYLQGKRIIDIANKYLNCVVSLKKDLQGFDRYIIIRNKGYNEN